MRYYAQYSLDNKLIAIGTGPGGTEITESEYKTLLTEIKQKATLVNQLYDGEISTDDIPEEWQEEIQNRVNERIEWQGTLEEQDISDSEALNIILGGE